MNAEMSVLITDLDNTLFDWVDVWYKSFTAMLDRLALDSGVPRETLIPEFKAIHERHGTSEYAFSIQELPSLQAKYPGEDLAARFGEAIHAYRTARKCALKLYPNVAETLESLKDKGCLLIGYTESLSFYTGYRVRNLGLDRILDYLYSPPDHELPNGLTPAQLRAYPGERYELRRTIHRHIPAGELKPNPKVLLDIIREIGASRSEVIYVGDSLMKDVRMAQNANVTNVWAEYGQAQNREEYELLRRVTHWTAADVARETRITAGDVKPEHVLETGFDQILSDFNFTRFLNTSRENIGFVTELWKKTVEVQQHFNDLELRIRNFALTIIAAVLGLAAYALKDNLKIILWRHEVSLAAALLVTSVVVWLAFYFMDRWWYHRLLYGAVDHGRFIENRWKNVLPEFALTDSIGKYSPFPFFGRKIHTPRKIDIFYGAGVAFLFLLAYFAQFVVHPSAGTNMLNNPPNLPVSPTAQASPPGKAKVEPTDAISIGGEGEQSAKAPDLKRRGIKSPQKAAIPSRKDN
jgi:phosphoglycolate phosphatase-like HAD superfamily hydrolase